MRQLLVLYMSAVALCSCGPAVGRPIQSASIDSSSGGLALQRVQLYETGVGYFERAGKLLQGRDVLSLPASHVDDALKTLMIFSDGVPLRVSGVEFESVLGQALARVQAGLPSDPRLPLSYPMLLESLRGVRVEVREPTGQRTIGRLVDVTVFKPEAVASRAVNDQRRRSAAEPNDETEGPTDAASAATPGNTENPPQRLPRYLITVVEADGAVARFDAASVASVRPVEPALAKRLDSAVATASGRGAQSTRAIKISAPLGVPIRVGYVTETPVWRVTYRLVLGTEGAASTLQGWVLVHNDSDERWQDIALEIINGKPQSFLYPLTAPRYLRRSLNAPEEEMSTLPQLARKTPDQIWGDRDDASEEFADSFSAGGLALSGTGEGGGGMGYGSGAGSLSGRRASPAQSSEITVGNLASLAPSDAMPSGANFRYRIGQPVTLSAHSSALVPFTQIPVKAELMTRFGWGDAEGTVSAQIANGSGQTLPAGPIAVYAAAGLAGETNLVRLASGQSSWLSYGTDLDSEIEHRGSDVRRNTTQLLRLEDQAQLVEHYVRHSERMLHIVNRSTLKRRICLELPVGSNAQVLGADRLEFDPSAGKPLAIFDLLPRSDLDRTLVIEEALKMSTPVESLDEQKLSELLASKTLDAKSRSTLLEAAAFLAKNHSRHKKLEDLQQQLSRLEGESKRVEDKLEKLKGIDGNAAAPLVRRVVELEAARNRAEVDQKSQLDAQAAELPALVKIVERLNQYTSRSHVTN